jgi:hypothetical protein
MRLSTLLHQREGTMNLPATVAEVAKVVRKQEIDFVAVFSSLGNGALMLSDLVDESIRIVAVTFPAGTTAQSGEDRVLLGIPSAERRRELAARNISIVQGTMPLRGFDEVRGPESVGYIRRTLEMFGGSLSLCVQAVLMACDAGAIMPGSRCISMTSDTAAIFRAEHAHRLLAASSKFAVEHIICKPLRYSVTRPAVAMEEPARPKIAESVDAPRAIEPSVADREAGGASP